MQKMRQASIELLMLWLLHQKTAWWLGAMTVACLCMHLAQRVSKGSSTGERRQCRACRLMILLLDQLLASTAADHVHRVNAVNVQHTISHSRAHSRMTFLIGRKEVVSVWCCCMGTRSVAVSSHTSPLPNAPAQVAQSFNCLTVFV